MIEHCNSNKAYSVALSISDIYQQLWWHDCNWFNGWMSISVSYDGNLVIFVMQTNIYLLGRGERQTTGIQNQTLQKNIFPMSYSYHHQLLTTTWYEEMIFSWGLMGIALHVSWPQQMQLNETSNRRNWMNFSAKGYSVTGPINEEMPHCRHWSWHFWRK